MFDGVNFGIGAVVVALAAIIFALTRIHEEIAQQKYELRGQTALLEKIERLLRAIAMRE